MSDWEDIFTKHGKFFLETHSDMPMLVHLFHEHKVRRVLDLGCGSGRHLVFFSREGFEVYGFDSSGTAISLAHQWLEEEQLTAEIVVHRMENAFPYDDSFFDAVISVQVIHHNLFQDIVRTVSEIARVVRRGGVLFVSVPLLPLDLTQDDLQELEPSTYIPRSGLEKGVPHYYFKPDELKDLLSSFTPIDVRIDNTRHTCFLGMKKRNECK